MKPINQGKKFINNSKRKMFRKGVVTDIFEINKQRKDMKKLYYKTCKDLPITREFNHRNFLYELKPIFRKLLNKSVNYKAFADFNIQPIYMNENEMDETQEDELVETIPADFEKNSIKKFKSLVREVKKNIEESADIALYLDQPSESECEEC
jgi:hypothetical protein